MGLREQLERDMKDALRSRDTVRLETIRRVRGAVRNREIELGGTLDDEGILRVIRGLVKQRLETKLLHYFSLSVAGIFMSVLIADMGYYAHNHSHLDYVFFEYLSDLTTQGINQPTQASNQTESELQRLDKWGIRLISFFVGQAFVIWLWTTFFNRRGQFFVTPLKSFIPRNANVFLGVCPVVAGTGLDPYGTWASQRSKISSAVVLRVCAKPHLAYG